MVAVVRALTPRMCIHFRRQVVHSFNVLVPWGEDKLMLLPQSVSDRTPFHHIRWSILWRDSCDATLVTRLW